MSKQDPDLKKNKPDWIRNRLEDGIELLILGSKYASASKRDLSEYAIGIDLLRDKGLNVCDIRWLILEELAEHLIELTLPGDECRTFRSGGAKISPQSCLTLTRKGVEFASDIVDDKASFETDVKRIESIRDTETVESELTPRWDADRQELRYAGELVKRYRLPSPNQTAILSAFHEERWPSRIDDPLPPRYDQNPKRRLHDTIRNLNRSHHASLVRFTGDGSGQGVIWERCK